MATLFIDFGNVIGFFDHQLALAQLGHSTTLSRHELAQVLYGSLLEDRYERGLISTSDFIQQAKAEGKLNCTNEFFLAAYTNIFSTNQEVCDLIPKLAASHRLILASNTNAAHFLKYSVQFATVLHYFHCLLPSQQVGHRKPQGAYFEHCQNFATGSPADCFFLDDHLPNIDAAQTFGWSCIHYRPNQNLEAKLRQLGLL
jgi:glucose-1-phosphatase